MKFRASLVLFCCVCIAAAQAGSPAIRHARQNLADVKMLVDAGAAPANLLEQAQDALRAAEDEAVLDETLATSSTAVQDLTAEQAERAHEAAQRLLDRKLKQFEQTGTLVREGVLPVTSLETVREEVDRSRRVVEISRSLAAEVAEIAAMAALEEAAGLELPEVAFGPGSPLAEKFLGDGAFGPQHFNQLRDAFERKFAKPLPLSAVGQTAVHRALGFDHRDRVDVRLHPDQPEGIWLRQYLQSENIPYFAFRAMAAGRSTGPHIHVGPPSGPLAASGIPGS